MGYAYQHLLSPTNVGSGIAEQLLVSPIGWFTSLKEPASADAVAITATHQFASDKGFLFFQLAPERNTYDAKTVGERGSQKLEHELKIFISGSYEQAHEAVKHLLNEPLIALQKDVDCQGNNYYQAGTQYAPAWLKVDFSTGSTKDGIKGYSGTISWVSESILLYRGLIKKL